MFKIEFFKIEKLNYRPSYRPTDPPTYNPPKPRPSYLPPPPPPTIPERAPAPIYRAERNPTSSSSSLLPSPSISRLTITPQDQEFNGNRIEERVFVKDNKPEVKRTSIQLTPESIEEAWKDAPSIPTTSTPVLKSRKPYGWSNNRVSSKESNSNTNRRISTSFREASSGFPSFESQIRGKISNV